ncbi:MAG: phage portal protein [Solitalea-like symbiont of Tyrophagus putrescentiae]
MKLSNTPLTTSAIDKGRDIDKLIANKDISRIISLMQDNGNRAQVATNQYDTARHNIMKRKDKIITDKNGNYIRTQKRWRLPIPYQSFINEIALVFLYGRPVKWVQLSQDTNDAFQAFKHLLLKTRFDSKIRQCKRLAGAETESAMLFRVYKNSLGTPDVQIRVLAAGKGDEVRSSWDQYGNLLCAGWGYYTKNGDEVSYHFDLYTKNEVHYCKRHKQSWQVQTESNLIGKIPMIIFRQETEWDGVQPLIDREEYIASRTADVNDYFADPAVVATTDIINSLPDKESESKLYLLKEKGQVNYLTWDSAPEAKQRELEWLQKHILSKSFTPNLDFDNMKSLSNVSGKALKQMMVLADIKAAKHKETHDELLDRIAELYKAIIGNVLNYPLKQECDRLVIGHEFQEPFGEDIREAINQLIDTKVAGGMSTQTFLELHPLIKDSSSELERLQQEQDLNQDRSDDIFGRGI